MDIRIKVNKVYKSYLNCDKRYQIFYGGSSSGKSFFLAQRIVLHMLTGKYNYLIVRNTANTLRRSTFNEIYNCITTMNVLSYFSINKTDMIITCMLNGKQILFCGLDDPEKIKSIKPALGVINAIFVEEATEVTYEAFKQLDKRIRGESEVAKTITMAFNPILKTHWIYTEFFAGKWEDDNKIYQDDDNFILKTTYVDNEYLTEDDKKALANETDKYYYEVYSLGNWGVLGSVIFKNWTTSDCTEIRRIADNYKNACDFGFSDDPAAVIRTHYDKTRKTIYILDELYMTDLTNDMLADRIKQMIGREYITCDSSEPKSIKELKNYGVNALPAKKGKDSVNHGIQWLQQQNIIIDPKCKHTINEFSQYRWKEDKDGNALPVPIDKDNHLIDALRYAYEDETKSTSKWVNIRI